MSRDNAGGLADMPELMLRSEDKIIDGGGGGDSAAATNSFVRWEKFLPKMVLRVLLVEADDSTRQIITALLRKCSYKVAAVSDGLKAWEVLKGRSHNIDLILTEVELPSISGFALLTLIMEHQVCKNIPVIMMSAHDSVSTVYKCMLRGASDFLVKPVRKNELKNLWQHVWRRQSSTTGRNANQEESDAQQKVEATAENNENNATSNRSSGYIACIKRNRECIEKGSDAQSSCTKPDMEPDEPPMEQQLDHTESEQQRANQAGTAPMDPEGNMGKGDTSGEDKNMAIDVRWERVNVVIGNNNNNSREAIDLIGSFDSYPKTSYKSSFNFGENKVEHPSPMLDLSLRRSHPSSSVNQFSDDRYRLKQSDMSAFSRYINRGQPLPTSGSASISNQQKDYETNSDKHLSINPVGYISDTHSAPVASSLNIRSQHVQTESQSQNQNQNQFPSPKERVFQVPVPVRSSRFDNPCATYGSILPPFCEPMFQTNQYYMSNQEARNESQPELHNATETIDDHSANSSFCNGGTSLTRLNSIGSGSNGNNVHRSIQREAALNKFRMKRKDRCFDKKVRYESRKKLAEQRPRVKGQFVRQGGQTSMEIDAELVAAKTIA